MSRTSYSINHRVFFGGIGVLLFLILTGSSGYAAPASTSKEIDKAAKAKIQEAYGRLPLYFIQNNGQVDGKVKFYEKGNGHATFFTKEGVFLLLTRGQEAEVRMQSPRSPQRIRPSADQSGNTLQTTGGQAEQRGKDQKAHTVIASDQRERGNLKSEITRNSKPEIRSASLVLDLSGGESAEVDNSKLIKLFPLGANKDPQIIAEDQQAGKVNYFIGNDPQKWRTDIPTYRAVVYKEIYPGIDMKFYGNNRELEYDIIISPGADPSTVRLSYEGIESLRVTDEGELEIGLKACPDQGRGRGKIFQKKPYIYQVIDGKKVEVEGNFVIRNRESSLVEDSKNTDTDNGHGQRSYGFEVASYDKDHPIIIDPVIVYSTYLGGSGTEGGYGIAVDGSGNVYLTGSTSSTDFPTLNPLQPIYGGGWSNVFVTKINLDGNALVYSTYLGGSYEDKGYRIAVDGSGNAYLTGDTDSIDFPTQNPIQPNFAGGFKDAFVTKISPSGDALVYSTYLGGREWDGGNDIAVDGSGNVYLIGNTNSSDFPTQNPLQPNLGGEWWGMDAFVTKINPTGDALVYSTYLGGSGTDWGSGIAVDGSGNVYLTGYTRSTDFPTQNPLQPNHAGGYYDAFITKISPAGDALVYSTYLGGSSDDGGRGIAVDSSGNAYLTGDTDSIDFPAHNPIQPNIAGDEDAFVTKINPAGDVLVYSTYFGGNSADYGYGIAVDSAGNAYLTGKTSSSDFPTQNPIQPIYGGGYYDAFVTKINPAGEALVYSTYFGGSSWDDSKGIAVDSSGNVYLIGRTSSTDFLTRNPLQPDIAGWADAFVTKIWDGGTDIKANGSDGPVIINEGDSLSVTITLDAGDSAGTPADWYVYAPISPFGPYYYIYPGGWVPGSGITYSGPLCNLTPYEVLNTTGLPIGAYTICFDVDPGVLYSDCVEVTITVP